jgi:hypothetical protein
MHWYLFYTGTRILNGSYFLIEALLLILNQWGSLRILNKMTLKLWWRQLFWNWLRYWFRRIFQKLKKEKNKWLISLYLEVNNLDLSKFQIFCLEQLNDKDGLNGKLLTDHCFVSCLNSYKIDSNAIEFAKGIIKDLLRLKH